MGVQWVFREPKSQIGLIVQKPPTKGPFKSGYMVTNINRKTSCLTILAKCLSQPHVLQSGGEMRLLAQAYIDVWKGSTL